MYTLQGKTRPTRHTLSTLSSCMVHDRMYLTRSTYSKLSYNHQQIWTDPIHPRRRAPDTIHSTTVIRSVGPYPAYLPQQPKSSGEKSCSCWQPTTRFTRPISPACDRYIQYLLTGANLTTLNRHRWGYNLEGDDFPCTTPWPSRPDVSLSPSGPTRSPFNPVPAIKPKFLVLENLWPPRGLSTTRPSTRAYIYA
jgi:hypothetical protein